MTGYDRYKGVLEGRRVDFVPRIPIVIASPIGRPATLRNVPSGSTATPITTTEPTTEPAHQELRGQAKR